MTARIAAAALLLGVATTSLPAPAQQLPQPIVGVSLGMRASDAVAALQRQPGVTDLSPTLEGDALQSVTATIGDIDIQATFNGPRSARVVGMIQVTEFLSGRALSAVVARYRQVMGGPGITLKVDSGRNIMVGWGGRPVQPATLQPTPGVRYTALGQSNVPQYFSFTLIDRQQKD